MKHNLLEDRLQTALHCDAEQQEIEKVRAMK